MRECVCSLANARAAQAKLVALAGQVIANIVAGHVEHLRARVACACACVLECSSAPAQRIIVHASEALEKAAMLTTHAPLPCHDTAA